MRSAPTITSFDTDGNSGKCNRLSTGVARFVNSDISILRITTRNANLVSGSGTASNCIEVQYIADSEL